MLIYPRKPFWPYSNPIKPEKNPFIRLSIMPDVIEVEVFNKLFASIAEEMGIILAKSSFSSNIKERRDFSCAIFDARGDLVAQAAHIPVHLGSMPMTVKHVLATHVFAPGDMMIVNDPFTGGSHLPDITLIAPVFNREGKVLFYVADRAHHADVGGRLPGSMGMLSDLDDEGVLIPPTFLRRQGVLNTHFIDEFLGQVRNPVERQGDLHAQAAALSRGNERLLELVDKYGIDHLSSVLAQLQNYAERLMRSAIARIPAGSYSFTDYLDDDGIANTPLPIAVKLIVDGEQAQIDFRHCARQVRSPINTVQSVTRSAVVYVFQCLLGDGYPINQGSYRPLSVITRPGTIVDASRPAPVAAGNVETSQRIVDVLLGALAQAIPNRIPAASCGSMNNVAIGSLEAGSKQQFTYYETIGGGMGARPDRDGLHGIHTHMTNTLNTPVEALEHAYPLEVVQYSLRHNSGGNGRYRGGDGIVRAYRFLDKANVSLLTERRRLAPYGLAGGRDGRRGENILVREGCRTRLAGKTNFTARPGDTVIIKSPSGGGWGRKP
jgi:N-methylhydantoinase B